VVAAVALLTIIGAMAAHGLARYRFRGAGASASPFFQAGAAPQLLIPIAVPDPPGFRLYNSLLGLVLVYVAAHLGMTVYILEGFFAQIPQDLFDAARMDAMDIEIFWRIALPIGMPNAVHDDHAHFIIL